ncbi:restriction endonuclease subunit S [Massilia sp. FT127W]|uniref:Restriction endonuclease subunit S n=2 Tax=Pseudoduganella aquatica TaxID=2660641 RepID=A0A7X4KQI7_9BURK|nr:restriction endonuclease subunit S [Pseudoduganella aquatica]
MKIDRRPALVPKLRFPEFRDAGAWKTQTLGTVAAISTEKVGDNTCIPMSITSGVGLVSQMEKFGRVIAGSSYKNYLLLKKNDFAYNKSATKEYPEGFIALYSGDELAAVPNSIFTCFRIKGDSPAPLYLNYLLIGNLHGQWLRKFIQVGARAHGSLSVDEDDLLALPVPLPQGETSLQEQQKIADCLSSVDELIAAQSRKLDALKTHKKGLMQQLFPLEGETQPRFRFPEFQDAVEWEEKTLGEIVEVASGLVDPTKPPYCDMPHIGGENIESHTGDLQGVKTARELGLISGKYFFDGRDVLYSKIRPALNKVAIPDFEGICSADIYPLRPSNQKLNRQYLAYLLRSEGFLEYAIKHSDRSKIPKVNRDSLLAYELVIPCRSEQQRIADCLTSLDDLITAHTQKLDAFKTHKKGLMQRLFPSQAEVDA